MPPRKHLILIGNSVSSELKKSLQSQQDNATIPASIGFFDSGEPFVELFKGEKASYEKSKALLKDAHVTIVQSTSDPISDNCQHLLLMAHTLKEHGAASVTAVLPFKAFDRQDRQFEERFVSRGSKWFAQMLKASGVDKVITLTPHSGASVKDYEKEFGKGNFTALATTDLFADDIRQRFGNDLANIRIGAPDGGDKPEDEGQLRAKAVCKSLLGEEGCDSGMFKISKVHTGVSDTKITEFKGDVKGKDCAVVDDMTDGGSTIINSASALKAKGAKSVIAYLTHGILSGGALERILSAKPDGISPAVDTLVVTDTIPSIEQKVAQLVEKKPKLAERIRVLSAGQLLTAEIERQQALEPGFIDMIRPIGERRLA